MALKRAKTRKKSVIFSVFLRFLSLSSLKCVLFPFLSLAADLAAPPPYRYLSFPAKITTIREEMQIFNVLEIFG